MTIDEKARVKHHAIAALQSASIVYYTVPAEGEIHDFALAAQQAVKRVVEHLLTSGVLHE